MKKGEALITALYVCILDTLRSQLLDGDFKYPTINHFVAVYSDQVEFEPQEEIMKLWQFANWSFILYKMIPAKMNKVFAMEVIPKLVEGWNGTS